MINMDKRDKQKLIRVLAVIMGVVYITATVLVTVLGVYSKTEGYKILLHLSPMIIGIIITYSLLIINYSKEK